jgi:hypothetical protein
MSSCRESGLESVWALSFLESKEALARLQLMAMQEEWKNREVVPVRTICGDKGVKGRCVKNGREG